MLSTAQGQQDMQMMWVHVFKRLMDFYFERNRCTVRVNNSLIWFEHTKTRNERKAL